MAYATRPENAPVWAETGDKTRPVLDNDIAIGWPQAVTPPPRQKWNWLLNQLSRGMRYYLQQGIPEWNATEEYQAYAYVKHVGVVYRSLSPIIGGSNPLLNTTSWEKYGLNMTDVNNAITSSLAGYATFANVTNAVNNALAIFNPGNLPPASMGVFNNGKWRTYLANGTFVVPAGITQIRVRVVGGGGGGASGAQSAGGSGGGFAVGVFTVVPGASYNVSIGAAGAVASAGGATAFGVLISASGGAGGTQPGAGAVGAGAGGDLQFSGGPGGAPTNGQGGGGAAGSQAGPGGAGGSGGGGVGGCAGRSGGGSLFGYGSANDIGAVDAMGMSNTYLTTAAGGSAHGIENGTGKVIRFPFDGFTGGGGGSVSTGIPGRGGPGGGGGPNNDGIGGAGGTGGGGGASFGGVGKTGGVGGLGGGGGAGIATGGVGGQGVCVVEY